MTVHLVDEIGARAFGRVGGSHRCGAGYRDGGGRLGGGIERLACGDSNRGRSAVAVDCNSGRIGHGRGRGAGIDGEGGHARGDGRKDSEVCGPVGGAVDVVWKVVGSLSGIAIRTSVGSGVKGAGD